MPLKKTVPESESAIESIRERFNELMEIPGVPWIVYVSLLIVLVLIAIYVAGLFRNMALNLSASSPDEDLDVIREIHNRGLMLDEEFDKAKQRITENIDADQLLKRKDGT